MNDSPSPSPFPPFVRRLLLEDLRRAGIEDWLLEAPAAESPPAESSSSVTPRVESPMTEKPVSRSARTPSLPSLAEELDDRLPGESLPLEARIAALEELRQQVAACTRCLELVDYRTQTVFGVGNPMARLCFLGEAPGADEDQQGEPFVGRAGQLLTRIIEACQMKREDVYILNILKCRPPGNRTPLPAEAANCRPFLDRQLEIIRPEFLVCLGASAAQNLLDTTVPISKLRGRFYRYRGIRVLATYHPAYLLRNPSAKRLVWEDMKQLMREMGIPIP